MSNEGNPNSTADDKVPVPAAQLKVPSSNELRDELQNLVELDLQGPKYGEQEELDETRVVDRYFVGMLAPPKCEVGQERDDSEAVGGADKGDDGDSDDMSVRSDSMFPSSLGLSFVVDEATTEITIEVNWGRYEKQESQTGIVTKAGQTKRVWRRFPMTAKIDRLRIDRDEIEPTTLLSEAPDIFLRGIARILHGQRIVTLFLVNNQGDLESQTDENWMFQVKLRISAPDGSPIFRRRPLRLESSRIDPVHLAEEREMEMLYRWQLEFGVGHGTAVHADVTTDRTHATAIETVAIPRQDVYQQGPPTADDKGFEKLKGMVVDMKVLAESEPAKYQEMLTPLVGAYADWIKRQGAKVSDPLERLQDYLSEVTRVTKRCERALDRIRRGIELVAMNPIAGQAFQFANRAMWYQRVRSKFAEERRRGRDVKLDDIDADARNRSWYPFQLAFVLLNIESIVDLNHEDRSHPNHALADLLWFPTGGGKTEAYLGLAAFTMAVRRLQGMIEGRSGAAGVTVLMRYTLRLLTLQQFQRASALICACEQIRRDAIASGDSCWGDHPFLIGLWVGKKTTPNSTAQSAEAVRRDHGTSSWQDGGAGSPAQLTNCPWCGCKLDAGQDIDVESVAGGRGRTLVYCSDNLGRCLFGRAKSPDQGLPVLVVDEEIYRQLPSLLIATVDKFAQMPWDGRTQMLFGRVDGYCPRHGFVSSEVDDAESHRKRNKLPAVSQIDHPPLRPPDLIIQDELHLISGPLGSLVGLYETAIDELCSWKVAGTTVRPKVIASTATIRNAASQIHSLFLRKLEIFPPPGTEVTDNFFSIRRLPGDTRGKPSRRYIGVCAPGRAIKAALIRTYTAYMAAAQLLYEKYGSHLDPWMTLVGYFNSMRELAGMRRLVEDDVSNRLTKMDQRGLARRNRPSVDELTSRKRSTDIPHILDHMEAEFDPRLEAERKDMSKKGERPTSRRPLDVLLATNMISVGVDIRRLGLMVVGGQPKATSEYIQATSRVGRSTPGLVCTVYNWARPRDLSHYERFEHYHATFYQQVEALSVTPFAPRALDRGLTALFVALVRLSGRKFNANEDAKEVVADHPYLKHAIETIVHRVEQILNKKSIAEDVKEVLKRRLDEWRSRSAKYTHLGYKYKKDGMTVPLLEPAGPKPWSDFTCLNSLRDVEPTSGLILKE